MIAGPSTGGASPRVPRLLGVVADHINRRTDSRGNGLPRSYYFRRCVIGDTELADSPLERAVRELEVLDPFQGGRMRWRYEKLLELRRTYMKTSEFVWEQVVARREASEEHNRQVGLKIEAERTLRRNIKAQKDREIGGLNDEVFRFKFLAVPKIAAAGGACGGLSDPRSDCLPTPQPLSEQIVAADESLPLHADDLKSRLKPVTVKVATLIMGAVVAASAGAAFGSSLPVQPGVDTAEGLACCVFLGGTGWVVAMASGWAVEIFAYFASQAFCLGNRKSGFAWLKVAAGLFALYCVLDAVTGQQGLFRSAAVQAAIDSVGTETKAASAGRDWGTIAFSYTFGLSYLAMRVGLGIIDGRRAAMNRVLSARKKAHDAALAKFTDTDEYRSAAEAVANVRLVEQYRELRVSGYDAELKVSEAREEKLAGTVRELVDGPDEHQATMLRNLHDELSANLIEFETDLIQAYDHIRRPWYARAWYWLFGWIFRLPLRKVRG